MNYSLAHSRQYRAPYSLDNISDYINRNWFRALTIGLGVYILFFKDISIQFNLNSAPSGLAEQVIISPEGAEVYQPAALPASYQDNAPRNVSHLAPPVKEKKGQKGWDSRKANDFSNLTFVLSPDYARRHNIHPDIVREKVDNCRRYVEEYAPIALKEMEDYGIPASITLAQGLLESNAATAVYPANPITTLASSAAASAGAAPAAIIPTTISTICSGCSTLPGKVIANTLLY